MMRHRILPALAAMTFAAACSSAKSSAPPRSTTEPATSATTTAAPTKASYLAAANAICRTLNDQVNALGTPPDDMNRTADLNDRTEHLTADALRKLRALAVPPGEAANISAIYAKVDRVLSDAAPFSAALRAGDRVAAQDAQSKLETDLQAVNTAATDYGLDVCGA
jgi:hypothetical protein